MEQAGEISHLKGDVCFPIHIDGILITLYRAPFTYRDKKGKDIVEDFKGPKTQLYIVQERLLWATKRILIKEV